MLIFRVGNLYEDPRRRESQATALIRSDLTYLCVPWAREGVSGQLIRFTR